MMEIQFFGHSCFRIKGKSIILITDPFDPATTGLKFPKTFADIITVSHPHPDHNFVAGVKGTKRRPQPFVVSAPGEYEIGGVGILGIPSFHDTQKGKERGKNTIFLINMEEIRLVHLGDLGEELSEEQVEKIGEIDILFIPVGGKYTIDSKKALGVVNALEPKVVIPMHYKLPHLSFDLAPVEDFLKLLGAEGINPLPKFIISKEKLPEERQVVVLDARS